MGQLVTRRIAQPDPARWDGILMGKVRPSTDGWPVERLFVDAHPRLASKLVDWIENQARERFEVEDAHLVHRTGEIPAGETIVLCASRGGSHRDCREANRWMLEATKRHLPVWKREEGPRGERWMDGRELQLPDRFEKTRRVKHA